jgi:hypothetical protein
MVQIGGYLTSEEHAEFRRYAARFQLKDSSLANLLIARELRCNRLERLREVFSPTPLKARSRVTAHQSDHGVKAAFEACAIRAGVSTDLAAALVFRAELAEQWLEKATTVEWNQIDSKPDVA